MPNDVVRALPTRQDVQTFQVNFDAALNYYAPQIADALPEDITLRQFKQVLLTAINQSPDLYAADRVSLFNACVKCAQDGLLPDGQEAALVVFNTEIKRRDEKGIEHNVWVPLVQYMPMIRGIRKRMRNSGEVLKAVAHVVYRNDKFRHVKGEEEKIEHEPCELSDDPGEPVGAYAIITLANGEILRDVMSVRDIEKTRAQSRAKNSLKWTKFWDEGAKVVVLRRCAKGAPQDSRVRSALGRDDEPLGLPEESHFMQPPPRPSREIPARYDPLSEMREKVDDPGGKSSEASHDEAVDEAETPGETLSRQSRPAAAGGSRARGPTNEQTRASAAEGDGSSPPPLEGAEEVADVTDCDGQVWETPLEEVKEFLDEIFIEARRRGPKAVEAAIENNEHLGAADKALAMIFALQRQSLGTPGTRKRATKAETAKRRHVDNALSSGHHDRAEQDAHIVHVERQQDPAAAPTAPGQVVTETAASPTLTASVTTVPSSRVPPPAIDYTVQMPMGDPKTALRLWALHLLPQRLRKCKDKVEFAAVLDIADVQLKKFIGGMGEAQYKSFQAELDAIREGLP